MPLLVLDVSGVRPDKVRPIHIIFGLKQSVTMKTKRINEVELMSLLQRVLPKSIYDRVEREVQLLKNLEAFEKFCEEGSIENLQPETVSNLREQLAASFGEENVAIVPDESSGALEIEISLPDRQAHTRLKVQDPNEIPEEGINAPFVPFPVALPEDPALIWILARRENFGPDEAARALFHIQEEYWASKNGQIALRKGAERTFAEFISRVPASVLAESGMRRHYKEPEILKILGSRADETALEVETTENELATA